MRPLDSETTTWIRKEVEYYSVNSISITELSQIAWDARGEWQSHLNCGIVSRNIRDRLDEEGIAAEIIFGEIVADSRRSPYGDEHAWVEVPKNAIKNMSGDVLIDGTINQFCEENKRDGKVGVALDSRAALPKVAIFVQGRDEEFSRWYSRRC